MKHLNDQACELWNTYTMPKRIRYVESFWNFFFKLQSESYKCVDKPLLVLQDLPRIVKNLLESHAKELFHLLWDRDWVGTNQSRRSTKLWSPLLRAFLRESSHKAKYYGGEVCKQLSTLRSTACRHRANNRVWPNTYKRLVSFFTRHSLP